MKLMGITFDLWYTLIYETEEDEAKYQEMRLKAIQRGLEEAGFSFDSELLKKSFTHLRKYSLSVPYEAFLKLIASSLGLSLSGAGLEDVKQRYIEEIEKYEVKLGPGVPDVLEELKNLGVRIAVVSNTSFPEKPLWKILGRRGISQFLDAIVSSSDEGVEKPNPAIFAKAQSRLGIQAERILHVGDSCVEDYLGPISFGMRAVLYKGLYQYRKEKSLHELCLANSIASADDLREILRYVC